MATAGLGPGASRKTAGVRQSGLRGVGRLRRAPDPAGPRQHGEEEAAHRFGGHVRIRIQLPSHRGPTGAATIGGRSAVGSASPCQGEGRGFESRRPLGRGSGFLTWGPSWWDGREARQRPAKPCTRVRIPFPPRGTTRSARTVRAISSAGERFPDTEEVTGSIPVSPTSIIAAPSRYPTVEQDQMSKPAE